MNRKDTVVKSTRIITVSFCDADITALTKCIDLDPVFPPTPSELVKILARGQMARLLNGHDELKDLYQNYGKSPVVIQSANVI